jgi:phage host-nuclease inhibitor protein Gam
MIELLPTDVENVIGFRMSGKIAARDLEQVTGTIEAKLRDHAKVSVYAEVESFDGMSLDALWHDLKFTLRHFQDVEKEAIVTDREWLTGLAGLGSVFAAGEVRVFPTERKPEALAWVKG